MAIFTGTHDGDAIGPDYISPGVVSNPVSSYPGSSPDTIYGNGGEDRLDGGMGADWMAGGEGADTYYVDNINDMVVEDAGQSTYSDYYHDYYYEYDAVVASVSWTLNNVVILELIGQGNLNGTGTEIGNLLRGNVDSNRLSGLAGNDYLVGRGGADTLLGGDGNDHLYGEEGVDVLQGGSGNDAYYLDDYGTDSFIELAGGGIDSLIGHTEADVTLAANIENLWYGEYWYFGEGVRNVTGNSLSNEIYASGRDNNISGLGGSDTIYAGDGSDSLRGDTGADTMYGQGGNDFYYVDTAGDAVIEAVGEGLDTVYATTGFTLGANVETLALVGTTAANGTGNGANNNLYGNSLANTLRGLGGADTFRSGNGVDVVIGGTGADLYQFLTVTGSTPASRDVIRAGDGAVAFEAAGAGLGDRFDLSQIDASTQTSGVQDFVFGTATGRGRLWAVNSGSNTLIRGNTDSDTAAEFEVAIEDGTVLASAYSAADFLL